MLGISGTGRTAEDLFRDATGARKPDRTSDGDAELEGHLVEVKKATTLTVNQVRAVKYLPLVIYQEVRRRWYVVPPQVVVAEVNRKTRGQHTENPFESATLTLTRLGGFKVAAADLGSQTLLAIRQGDRYPEIKEAMERIRARARAQADASLRQVRKLISKRRIRIQAP